MYEFLPSGDDNGKAVSKALKAIAGHPAWAVIEVRMREILQQINENNYTPELAVKQPTAGRFIHKFLTAVEAAKKQEATLVIEVGK